MASAKKMTSRARVLLFAALAVGSAAACTAETAPPTTPMPTAGTGGSGAQGGSSNPGGSGGSATSGSGGSVAAGTGGVAASAGSGGAPGGTGGATAGTGGAPPVGSGKPISIIAYSPYRDGQAPGAAQPTMEQVRSDLELLKPLVDGVRIYGTDGGNAFVPALCDELGLDLYVGAWIDGLASDGPNVMALAALVNENHPSIKAAVVGNEVLNRTEDNGLVETDLLAFVQMARDNITVDVPIAVAETYPRWMEVRPNLAAAVDIMIWHTYGWWAGADIEDAAALITSRYQDMLAGYPGKTMFLGETGWPSQFDNMSEDLTTTAVGSEANQARYFRELAASLGPLSLPFWPFSAFDENWKATSGEGEVGAHWGIFNADRTPKQAATELLMQLPP